MFSNSIIGISSLTNEKVNPNQPSNFTCSVQGDPLPVADVGLYLWDGNEDSNNGITTESSTTLGSERHVIFSADTVAQESVYRCYLVGTNYFFEIDADTYGEFYEYENFRI